jgi:hypothetical protein
MEVSMKAFSVRLVQGDILDVVIRAADESDARTLVAEEDCTLEEINPDVARAIGTPAERGRHKGVLTRWMRGPTTLTGELLNN